MSQRPIDVRAIVAASGLPIREYDMATIDDCIGPRIVFHVEEYSVVEPVPNVMGMPLVPWGLQKHTFPAVDVIVAIPNVVMMSEDYREAERHIGKMLLDAWDKRVGYSNWLNS